MKLATIIERAIHCSVDHIVISCFQSVLCILLGLGPQVLFGLLDAVLLHRSAQAQGLCLPMRDLARDHRPPIRQSDAGHAWSYGANR